MRNAAGQRGNAGDALGAEKLGFHLFPARDVRQHGEHRLGPAGRVPRQRPMTFEREPVMVPGLPFQFTTPFTVLQQRRHRQIKQGRIAG